MAGRHRRSEGSAPRTEASEWVAWMERLIDGWGDHIASDPAAGVHYRDLQRRLEEALNLGLFQANRGSQHYSLNEIGRMYGLTKQAIAHRIKLGEQAYVAASSNVIQLGVRQVRRDRAAALGAAGVPDRTGSEREKAAGQ